MAINGFNASVEELNVNFACVTWDAQIGYPFAASQAINKVVKLCGGLEVASKTVILLCPVNTNFTGIPSKFQYAQQAILLLPKKTLSNNDMTYLWKNKTIERFYNGQGDATNSSGTPCIFSFDKIPEFQFTGIHLYDNSISFDVPPARDITTYPTPATRVALGADSDWATFVVDGYDATGTPPVYESQINTTWLTDFFTKYGDKGVIPFCVMTMTPNINVTSSGSTPVVTTLAALTDVSLGTLPTLHTTTRLSYVPTTSKWQNVPVLQLHEWTYKLNYATPPDESTFLFNNNTVSLANRLAIHKISLAKYQDDNWLTGAVDVTRKNLLKIESNTFALIYRISGAPVDYGTWKLYTITYVDGYGNAIVPDDVCQFSVIDDTPIIDATNVGTGLGVYDSKSGQQLRFKAIDTGTGLMASTSPGNAINIALSATLDDLGDVNLTTPPTVNQVLQFNGADWVAGSLPTSSLNNFTATVDPTNTNDSSQGYSVGSQWLNTTVNQLWFCASAAVGNAKWRVSTTDYSSNNVRASSKAVIVSGNHNVAMGFDATVISGNDSVVIGRNSAVDGSASVAIGHTTDVQDNGCVGIGYAAVAASNRSVAIGYQATSNQNGSVALGPGATTTLTERLALGFNGNSNINVGTQFTRLPTNIDGTARQILMRDTDLGTRDLTDVSTTVPTNGQVLQYNSTSTKYEPVTLPTAPITAIANVGTGTGSVYKDVTTGTANLRSVIAGSNQMTVSTTTNEISLDVNPSNIPISSLSGVSITTPANAQVITYDTASTSWKNSALPVDSVQNVGAGAGQVYRDTVNGDVSLRTLTPGSNKLSVAVVGDTVALDVVPSNITIGSLSGAPTGAVVGTTDTQTLSNKSLVDSSTFFTDDLTPAKIAQFQCSSLPTGTTTFTFPATGGELVTTGTAVINGGNATGTVTVGTNANTNLIFKTNNSNKFEILNNAATLRGVTSVGNIAIAGAAAAVGTVAGSVTIVGGTGNSAASGSVFINAGPQGAGGGASDGSVSIYSGLSLSVTSRNNTANNQSNGAMSFTTGSAGLTSGAISLTTGSAASTVVGISTGSINLTTGSTASALAASGSVGNINLTCGTASTPVGTAKNGGNIVLTASRGQQGGNNGIVRLNTDTNAGYEFASIAGSAVRLIFNGASLTTTRSLFFQDMDGTAVVCDNGSFPSANMNFYLSSPDEGHKLVYDNTASRWTNRIQPYFIFSPYSCLTSALSGQYTYFMFFTVTEKCTYNNCELYSVVGATGGSRCAIYTGLPTGGVATTRLAETNTVASTTSTNEISYAFSAAVTLNPGTNYTFAFTTEAAPSWACINGFSDNTFCRYNTTYYTSFPADLGGVTFTGPATERYLVCLK